MNDKELADKVVALGVGQEYPGIDNLYGIPALFPALQAKEFTRDWRVAGALMEKCDAGRFIANGNDWFTSVDDNIVEGESLPRAITEACVEALGDSNE